VPEQYSSGGKEKLGGISKQGDRCLRSLFTAGALAVIRYAKIHGTGAAPGLPHCAACLFAALHMSPNGTSRTWRRGPFMSVIEGKPDDMCSL
jgi:Transposase IS116/IS110/IS902 family